MIIKSITLFLFITVVLISILIVGFLMVRDASNHMYVIDIDRSSSDENGTVMIIAAENIDYSTIFNISSREEDNSFLLKPAEERANFISTENIGHYSDHIKELRKNHTFGRYRLVYTASSTRMDKVELKLISMKENYGNGTGLYVGDRSIKLLESMRTNIIFWNGSGLNDIKATDPYYQDVSFMITYTNCSFIEMWMDYDAKPKPDEGGGFEMKQYVVLDESGNLLFMYNWRIDTGVLEDWIGAPW